MMSPIGGGTSEAVALAESLAIRHRNGRIILALDLDEEEMKLNSLKMQIEERLSSYNNIQIIYAIPDIETEIMRMIKPDERIYQRLFYSRIQKKNIVKQEFVSFIKKHQSDFHKTKYYKTFLEAISA